MSLTHTPILGSLQADTADLRCPVTWNDNRFSQDRQVAFTGHLGTLHHMLQCRLRCRAASHSPQAWVSALQLSAHSAGLLGTLNYWFGFYTLRNLANLFMEKNTLYRKPSE